MCVCLCVIVCVWVTVCVRVNVCIHLKGVSMCLLFGCESISVCVCVCECVCLCMCACVQHSATVHHSSAVIDVAPCTLHIISPVAPITMSESSPSHPQHPSIDLSRKHPGVWGTPFFRCQGATQCKHLCCILRPVSIASTYHVQLFSRRVARNLYQVFWGVISYTRYTRARNVTDRRCKFRPHARTHAHARTYRITATPRQSTETNTTAPQTNLLLPPHRKEHKQNF